MSDIFARLLDQDRLLVQRLFNLFTSPLRVIPIAAVIVGGECVCPSSKSMLLCGLGHVALEIVRELGQGRATALEPRELVLERGRRLFGFWGGSRRGFFR